MIIKGRRQINSIRYGGYSTITKIFNGIVKVYEGIKSAFGAGFWQDDKPWLDNEAWKDN